MRSLILFIATFSSMFGLAQNKGDLIVGKWITDNGDSQIEFYQKEGKYYGKIIWLKEPLKPDGTAKTDIKNPNPAMRNSSIMGLVIVSELEFKNGQFVNGKIYSPKEGKTLDCAILSENERELKITISKSLFSTSRIWKRL